ncbi:hypothetical protein BLOT_003255 [Blomia tropicalis]|nr:hypothetical protein BLOT_003255 [Blomia tropicalis]
MFHSHLITNLTSLAPFDPLYHSVNVFFTYLTMVCLSSDQLIDSSRYVAVIDVSNFFLLRFNRCCSTAITRIQMANVFVGHRKDERNGIGIECHSQVSLE